MKYFVGCLGPLIEARQSSIIIACVDGGVYPGYYHAIRLHTFPDSLLYFLKLGSFRRFLSRCSASLSVDPLFSFRSPSSAHNKKIN